MSSFIGCKISLISKAGIRYEGILYTIDPRESTVALSKVKSFGTEDRKVERIIPPRDEIYEYIIFRGSDIQDLNVCEPSKESTLLSEDSAIVRAETSISGNLPPGPSEYRNSSAWLTNSHRLPASEKSINNHFKPSVNSKSKEIENQLNSTTQPIGSNRNNPSNSETKKQFSRKPENNNIGEHKYDRTKNKIDKSQKYISDRYNNNYQDYEYSYDSSYKYQGQHQNHHSYHGANDYGLAASRDYYHMKAASGTGVIASPMGAGGRQQRRAEYNHRAAEQYTYYGGPLDRSKLRGFESSEGSGVRDYCGGSGSGYGLSSASMAGHSMAAGQAHYYEYRPRNGDTGPRGGGKKNKSVSSQQQALQSARDGDVAKREETFKDDYDFETANAIIAKELENLNLASQDKKDLKDTECNEQKEDGELSETSDGAGYYDKTKSFFDNISSEMLDRANGKSVRPMNRKEERKINVETFGVAESNNRNLGRSASKWNRNNRYYSNKSTRSGGNGTYKNTNSNETFKKDVTKQPIGVGATGNSHRTGGYGNNRRPVLVDGADRGGDEY